MNHTSIFGLITARGGSKGVPRKNLQPVGGRPLISWTIAAARESAFLSDVIVSTDDEEIAEVCGKLGAAIPFMRPAELARDDSPHLPVILHALNWLQNHGPGLPTHLVLLQPTSPLRTTEDIDRAIGLVIDRNADSVVSVCNAPVHPYWTKSITEDGRLVDFREWPDDGDYRMRQTLPPAYALNGAVYVIRSDVLLERGSYFTDRTYAYVMPAERSLDIDTPWDLYLADLILSDRCKVR